MNKFPNLSESIDPDVLKGADGWLAFFCFSILGRAFFQAHHLFKDCKAIFLYQIVDFPFLLYALANLGMIIFACFIVFSLHMIREDAVKLTKIFLLSSIGFVFFTLILTAVSIFVHQKQALQYFNMNSIIQIIYYVVWFQYFRYSSRVANTYKS
ncbi:MAG: hypothetical protein ABI041_11825 [Bdellovibrionia bacterium]